MRSFSIFALCLLAPFATAAELLFDGKTLAGWEGDTAKTWRIEDGSITGGSLDESVPRNEFLSTIKSYADFELRVEFKMLGDKAKANAGIQFRTKRIPNHHEVSGYQADVGQDYWGALYDESRRKKVLVKPDPKVLEGLVKFDDWNEYVIRCEGPRVQLWLNGKQTVDYTEADDAIERSGIIALQVHGGGKTKVHYKNVRIEELSSFDTAKNANWHHWRGPNGDGSSTANPPTEWDGATGKNIAWKTPIPGRGSATPIVWGNRIFVVTSIKTDREAKPEEMPKPDPKFETKTDPPKNFYKFTTLCLDRATGKVLWERVAAEKVPHEGHHVTHSYAAGSPTTDGERLYVSFGSFGYYCYDLGGKLLWSRELGRLHTRLGWGEAVTPVVHGDSLLLNLDQEADSTLVCLDAKTGATKWTAKRDDKTTWTTPMVVTAAGRTQVIMNGTTRIRSHDLATGEVIWSCAGMTTNPIPCVVKSEDSLIAMSGYKGAAVVSVPLDSKGDLGTSGGTWRYAKGTPYVPSPVLVGNRLYFTEANINFLTILDVRTGKAVLERERLPGVSQFYASPVAAAGRIYFTDRLGTTLVIKAADSLEVIATNKLGEPVDASPVVVGNELYLRGDKHLFCIKQ